MSIMDYIKPEMLVIAVLLYVIGMMVKQAAFINDKYIPLILGVIGILVAVCWVAGDSETFGVTGFITSAVQGVLCAGLAVYGNQTIKQLGKKTKNEDKGNE